MFLVNQPYGLEIPWETLEGMLKGISAIDMNHVGHTSIEEAEQFILNYGYDYHDPADRDELTRIKAEAISFIQRRFLDADIDWQALGEETLDLAIPPCITQNDDIRKLLLLASQGASIEQRWACAVLKVMHIISHINNAILYRYFEAAKSQILSRYQKVLSYTDSGELLLGSSEDVQLALAGFEIKDEKSRDSILMKLLCKRENVAEEVFDMIGVRIITHTSAEAILAVEILRRAKILLFPNIIPSRSRNSLMDVDDFKIQYDEALEKYQWGETRLEDTLQAISQITSDTPPETFNPQNASTLESYRSMHLTQRQLIRVRMDGTEEETRFFFPYELQIVDEANYLQNSAGSSAHSLYKQKQLVQARRRVLGPLFIALRKQNRHATADLEPNATP